jgi:broad specificity phosphatase PhoE
VTSIPTRLIAIRHGEPEPASRGRCYGRHDFALSDRGNEQAQALARSLAGETLAAVYPSPAIRARDTALPIAAAHPLDPITIDGFAELDFGRFEGRSYDEIATNDPELYQAVDGATSRDPLP